MDWEAKFVKRSARIAGAGFAIRLSRPWMLAQYRTIKRAAAGDRSRRPQVHSTSAKYEC